MWAVLAPPMPVRDLRKDGRPRVYDDRLLYFAAVRWRSGRAQAILVMEFQPLSPTWVRVPSEGSPELLVPPA